jgi:hypothetical protein
MAVFVLGTPYLHRHTLKLAIVFSAAVVNIVTAHNDVRNYVELQAFKELQAIAIRLGVPGCGRNRGFKPWPTDNPHTLSFSCNPHALEKLKAMGHYPFNRHFTVDRGLIDRTFDPGKSEGTFVESPIKRIAPIANTGTSKGCPHQQGKAAMVIGSIPPSIYKFGQIILIDQKNRVIGAAIPEQVLRGFTWCSPSNGRFTRWIGIARLPSTSTNLRAIVFIKP